MCTTICDGSGGDDDADMQLPTKSHIKLNEKETGCFIWKKGAISASLCSTCCANEDAQTGAHKNKRAKIKNRFFVRSHPLSVTVATAASL